jgi:hypothetical protein
MPTDYTALAAAALPLAGAALVWALRLEGRVNTQEALHNELKADVSEIKADVKLLLTRK